MAGGAIIQSSGPQSIAQATLGLKGGDVPQNILVPDLTGTIELGRRTEPELLFEQDIIEWRAFGNQAAGGAGTFASYELLNPAGVVTVFWFSPVTITVQTIQIVYGEPASALGNAYPLFPIDTRVARASIAATVPIIRSGVPAAAINANILFRLDNTTSFPPTWVGPFVMGAEDIGVGQNHYVIESATVNNSMFLNFRGYSLPRRPK